MSHAIASRPSRSRRGFSLVALTLVLVGIGVVAALGVPRLLQRGEQNKADKAFKYLASVQAAQEQYRAQHGAYASSIDELDTEIPPPTYFTLGVITPGDGQCLSENWSLTLTRAGSRTGFGAYAVTFDRDGYDASQSTIDPAICPLAVSSLLEVQRTEH